MLVKDAPPPTSSDSDRVQSNPEREGETGDLLCAVAVGMKSAKAAPRGLVVVSKASSVDFLLPGWLDESGDIELCSSSSCTVRVGCGVDGQIAVAQWSWKRL